jgi:hypothetical protein
MYLKNTSAFASQKYKTKLKELRPSPYSFKITGEPGKEIIFDPVRKKYVKFTPEEYVRQNFAQYLIRDGKYPPGLMSFEVKYKQKYLKNRADILIHDRTGKPVMLIECKAESVDIDEKVFDQIIRYNLELRVPYIVVTNWSMHLACKYNVELNRYDQIDIIPLYDEL